MNVHYVQAVLGIALFLAPGWALTQFLRPRDRFGVPARLALAYIVGVAFVAGGLYWGSHFMGLVLRRATVLGVASLPVIVALAVSALKRGRRAVLSRPTRSTGMGVQAAVVVVAGVVSLAVLGDAATNPVTDWDGVMTWSTQAQFVRAERTVDAQVLRDERWFITNRGYPLLLPLMQVAVLETFDVSDDRVVRPLYAAFLPCFLVLLYGTTRRFAGVWAAAACVLVAALIPQLTVESGGGPAGAYSDFPLACFLGAGLSLLLWGHGAGSGILSGILLGGAVLSKNEGLPLAAVVAGVTLFGAGLWCWRRRAGAWRVWRRALPSAIAVTGVVLAALLVASWRSPIPGSPYGNVVSPLWDAATRNVFLGKMLSVFPVLREESIGAHWGWFWLAWGVVLAVGWRGVSRRSALAFIVLLVASVAGGLLAYGVALWPVELARTTWTRFLVQSAMASFWLFAVALGSLLRSRIRFLRWVGMAVVVGVVATSLPAAVRGLGSFLNDAWNYRGETLRAMEVRSKGIAYWEGVEAIRAAIPPTGAYLLLKGAVAPGLHNQVRYDLAPRRAWFLGSSAGSKRALEVGWRPGAPEVAVVTQGLRERPLLESRLQLAAQVPEFFLGQEESGIPLGFDSPPEGAEVRGRLVVSGWCQEAPEAPCDPFSLWVDGEPRVLLSLRRFSRPDVAAVLPRLGDCAAAGFEAEFLMDEKDAGPRTLTLFVRARGERFRRQDRRVTVAK